MWELIEIKILNSKDASVAFLFFRATSSALSIKHHVNIADDSWALFGRLAFNVKRDVL